MVPQAASIEAKGFSMYYSRGVPQARACDYLHVWFKVKQAEAELQCSALNLSLT